MNYARYTPPRLSPTVPTRPTVPHGSSRLTPEPAGARSGRWWPSLRLTAAEERQTAPEHHRALHGCDVHGANSDQPRLRLPLPVVQPGHAGCPAAPHVAISLKVVDLASRARCTHATRTRLTVSMWYKAQRALGWVASSGQAVAHVCASRDALVACESKST